MGAIRDTHSPVQSRTTVSQRDAVTAPNTAISGGERNRWEAGLWSCHFTRDRRDRNGGNFARRSAHYAQVEVGLSLLGVDPDGFFGASDRAQENEAHDLFVRGVLRG
jgi:hypothetical protein